MLQFSKTQSMNFIPEISEFEKLQSKKLQFSYSLYFNNFLEKSSCLYRSFSQYMYFSFTGHPFQTATLPIHIPFHDGLHGYALAYFPWHKIIISDKQNCAFFVKHLNPMRDGLYEHPHQTPDGSSFLPIFCF